MNDARLVEAVSLAYERSLGTKRVRDRWDW